MHCGKAGLEAPDWITSVGMWKYMATQTPVNTMVISRTLYWINNVILMQNNKPNLIVKMNIFNSYIFYSDSRFTFSFYLCPYCHLNVFNTWICYVLQALNLQQHQRDMVLKHLDHTAFLHNAYYKQCSTFCEMVHVGKILNMHNNGSTDSSE